MRRIGSELDVEGMALHRHVADKDEILDGIVERVLAEIPLPALDGFGRKRCANGPSPPAMSPKAPLGDWPARGQTRRLQPDSARLRRSSPRLPSHSRLFAGPLDAGLFDHRQEKIILHVTGAEIPEFAPKVGMKAPLETRDNPKALRTYRNEFADAIRGHHARGEPAGRWQLQFLIRRCAWHMLDHAWELEDRDLTAE